MKLLENLNWRYATKKFDSIKKISAADLELLKEAIRLSASSYGLQLYKVLIIEDAEIRQKLQPASWGQSQIVDASQVVVFCNYTKISEADIDENIQLKSKTQNVDLDSLKGYGEFIKEKVLKQSQESLNNWTVRQTYIALGNLLNACAELKIDTCPMEGFEPAKYNEILGLEAQGLNAAVVATIGYRSEEDLTQHLPKVRKSQEVLFETL